MATKTTLPLPQAQNPLILRCHRLMEAFAKSDDERDFYLDKVEGFILYANLDKTVEELQALEEELEANPTRYCMIPKLTFFETKKIMEGFVHEKVYDIDAKEKLMDIIQSREAREHFLEFIYDHHAELEKWQQFYQERSRIRIIEWLRSHHFHFVFEEDLDLPSNVVERLKENLFEKKASKELEAARKALITKAKGYYSNEALNPRPKRGRPPKQIQKVEIEQQVSTDIYTTVPPKARIFLFTPEITSVLDVTFSSKFESGRELLAHSKQTPQSLNIPDNFENISHKLAALRELSSKWGEKDLPKSSTAKQKQESLGDEWDEEEEEEEEEDDDDEEEKGKQLKPVNKKEPKPVQAPVAKSVSKAPPAPVKKSSLPPKKPLVPTAKNKTSPQKYGVKPASTINTKKFVPLKKKVEKELPKKRILPKAVVEKPKNSYSKPPVKKAPVKPVKKGANMAPQKPAKGKRLLRKTPNKR